MYLEVAREHGTYQLMKQEMDFSGTAKDVHFPANTRRSPRRRPLTTTKLQENDSLRWLARLPLNGETRPPMEEEDGALVALAAHLSMVSFTVLLFFALTGITLNHQASFSNDVKPQRFTQDAQRSLDESAGCEEGCNRRGVSQPSP